MIMEENEKRKLDLMAVKIRKTALQAIKEASSGHIGGSFSIADILAVLYFHEMNIDSKNPKWEDRDRFVLSKGHCTPTTYAALALKGFFPLEYMKTFRNIDSYLSGHIEMRNVPGVDMSAGSLGQGLSVAVGMALSAKTYLKNYTTYVVTGDGEIQEGQIWEAAMAAGYYKLDNLIAFVDNNNLQIDGTIEEVMSPYPIDEKFRAFGWNAINIDGNKVEEISMAISQAKNIKGKPTVIIAKTIKGKGVSVFENQVRFHGSSPTEEEYKIAFSELNQRENELEG
jgi:transketolase